MTYQRRRLFAQICVHRVKEEKKRMDEMDSKAKSQQQQSDGGQRVSIDKMFPGGTPG